MNFFSALGRLLHQATTLCTIRALGLAGLWILISGCSPPNRSADAPIVLISPGERLVYQRGISNSALIPIAGSCRRPGGEIEARLTSLVGNRGTRSDWRPVGTIGKDGSFQERLDVPAGWYRLDIRVRSKGTESRTSVDRMGVGEVFIVVGHSVAQGGKSNLPGATDDRVNTIAWAPHQAESRRKYEQTADPRFLPGRMGSAFTNGVVPAPFGHGPYFWARFAELVARQEEVPVLLLNAAFGGTSLEHWAKAAHGEPFQHSFVKAELRMPYINLHHALRRYALFTGVRALLADQGQNDWTEPDAGKVFRNYQTWIEQARADLGFPQLAVVVNRQTPPGNKTAIRAAQERLIRERPHCVAGPDYDTLPPEDRYDGIHLSPSGLDHAARLWTKALGPRFFKETTPCPPQP